MNFFMSYNNIQESYETIIQIHRTYNEPFRELLEIFEIGKDIILENGNYKSILISKQINDVNNFPPLLKIHFIKSTDNDKIIQYSEFSILDNSDYNNINRVFRNILFIFLTLVKITNTR